MTEHQQKISAHRRITYGLADSRRVVDIEDAVRFVQQRGFIFFWPVKGIDLPSLWTAVSGSRPVASAHDDPGHITWRWKDDMLDQKRWYYGKLLRGKATLVSLDMLPNFYALSERVADLDDFRLAYEAGHLSHEAHQIGEVLLADGPQNTVELRRRTRLSGKASKYRFQKALVELQRGLWILPVGIAEAGAWRYAYTYELLDRWLPHIASEARPITLGDARAEITRRYLDGVGAAQAYRISRLFGWKKLQTHKALTSLKKAGRVVQLEDCRWAASAALSP